MHVKFYDVSLDTVYKLIEVCSAEQRAADKVGAPQTSTISAMVSASQISAAANDWADGNPNAFGINGFCAGAEWMQQKQHQ